MIMVLFTIAGAAWGGLMARRRGGNRLDIAQYAGGFAIIFALLGLLATVLIDKAIG